MCKILCLTSHKPSERDAIIARVWRAMSATEKDGYGAAWFSPDGEIGHYKSSFPRIPVAGALPKFVAGFASANACESDGGALIIHGRTATCGVNEANTHPMLADGAALVHNGVVSSQKHDNENSTCDSELLMRAFLHGGIDEVAETVQGYYAFMMLRLVGKRRTLYVARDGTASLYAGSTAAGFAFATTEALLDVVKAQSMGPFAPNHCVTFTAPRRYSVAQFKPAEFSASAKFEASAARALGATRKEPRRFSSYRAFQQHLFDEAAEEAKAAQMLATTADGAADAVRDAEIMAAMADAEAERQAREDADGIL